MKGDDGGRGAGMEAAALLVITVVSLAAPVVAEWVWGIGMQVERARVVFLGW